MRTTAENPEPEPCGVFVISVAAEIVGVHPQTLRTWERAGVVIPARTQGRSRRYSTEDLRALHRAAQLAGEGVNIAGIVRILRLEAENHALRRALSPQSDDAPAG